MLCPKCSLISPEGTVACDCGYEFATGNVRPTKRTPPTPTPEKGKGLEVKALLVCGGLLIFTGAIIVFGRVAAVVSEPLWRFNGGLEDQRRTYLIAGLLLGTIAAVGLTTVGFFASKGRGWTVPPETWYVIICGVLPGILLGFGWRQVREGLSKNISGDSRITRFTEFWEQRRGTTITLAALGLYWVIVLRGLLGDVVGGH
jgi:hypothetical protein